MNRDGRSESEEVSNVMNDIYQILEENDECQYSLKELTENLTFVPDPKTIKPRHT